MTTTTVTLTFEVTTDPTIATPIALQLATVMREAPSVLTWALRVNDEYLDGQGMARPKERT